MTRARKIMFHALVAGPLALVTGAALCAVPRYDAGRGYAYGYGWPFCWLDRHPILFASLHPITPEEYSRRIWSAWKTGRIGPTSNRDRLGTVWIIFDYPMAAHVPTLAANLLAPVGLYLCCFMLWRVRRPAK